MASTEKLFKLGVHNTWEDLAEAHKIIKLERLKLTPTGRAVLRYLNYSESYIAETDRKARIRCTRIPGVNQRCTYSYLAQYATDLP